MDWNEFFRRFSSPRYEAFLHVPGALYGLDGSWDGARCVAAWGHGRGHAEFTLWHGRTLGEPPWAEVTTVVGPDAFAGRSEWSLAADLLARTTPIMRLSVKTAPRVFERLHALATAVEWAEATLRIDGADHRVRRAANEVGWTVWTRHGALVLVVLARGIEGESVSLVPVDALPYVLASRDLDARNHAAEEGEGGDPGGC